MFHRRLPLRGISAVTRTNQEVAALAKLHARAVHDALLMLKWKYPEDYKRALGIAQKELGIEESQP